MRLLNQLRDFSALFSAETQPWAVIIAHFNNPVGLWFTLTRFSLYSRLKATFWLIDNSSSIFNRRLAHLVLRLLTKSNKLIVRENVGREAGAYWRGIEELSADGNRSQVVVFTQDRIHQKGDLPKGVRKYFSPVTNRNFPYYPSSIGLGEICFSRLTRVLNLFPGAHIGFGGKRCAHGLSADERFLGDPWVEVVQSTQVSYFDYFSGACFAVDQLGLGRLRQIDKANKGLSEENYAFLWERLWGSVFSNFDQELIDYSTLDRNVWHSVGTTPNEKGPWFNQSNGIALSLSEVRGLLVDGSHQE